MGMDTTWTAKKLGTAVVAMYEGNEPLISMVGDADVLIEKVMLMAAAPDLLEACKELFEMATEGDPHELIGWAGAVDKARAAIAKATGK